jgi:hypothetical protein
MGYEWFGVRNSVQAVISWFQKAFRFSKFLQCFVVRQYNATSNCYYSPFPFHFRRLMGEVACLNLISNVKQSAKADGCLFQLLPLRAKAEASFLPFNRLDWRSLLYEGRLISHAHSEISRKRDHVFKQAKVGSKVQYFSYKLTYLFFDIVALSFNTFFPT